MAARRDAVRPARCGLRPGALADPGSEAAFITEHYWGYTRQRDGGTLEYEVVHPSWALWTLDEAAFEGPPGPLYGDAFADVLAGPPRSAFLAVGSEVAVRPGRRIAVRGRARSPAVVRCGRKPGVPLRAAETVPPHLIRLAPA